MSDFAAEIPSAPPRAWHGFLMGLACFAVYNLMDVIVKKLTLHFSPMQIVGTIAIFSQPWMFLFARRFAGPNAMQTHAPRRQLLRGCIYCFQAFSAFYGFQYLPLADTYTFIFMCPPLTILFAVLFLRERVTPLQIMLVMSALVGVMIAFHPTPSMINWAALLVLTGSAAAAVDNILLRKLSATDGLGANLIYSSFSGGVLALLFAALQWHWPDGREWLWFAIAGLLSAVAHAFFAVAVSWAPASQVTPTQYSQIIWGTLYGFLFFGNLPDFWIVTGAAIIIAAGIGLARLEYLATHRMGHAHG